MLQTSKKRLGIILSLSAALTGCQSATDTQTPTPSAMASSIATIDGDLFNTKAMISPPETVSCALEDGSQSTCLKFIVKHVPDDQAIGPFCPRTLDDASGIWDWDGENAGLYSVNRKFLEMLNTQGYTFYDPDGTVHIADIAVAQPAHDHACINVSEDADVEITLLLPQSPIRANAPTRLGTVSKVGLALDGAPIFSDAPSVTRTSHMPVLDPCAGHIDPGGWYHFHGTASDLNSLYARENIDEKCALNQDSKALFGFAFDGFPIYGSLENDGNTPVNLDDCGGHVTETSSYHYHASETFPNLPKCLTGVMAQNNFVTTAQAGVGATRPAGGSPRNEPPGGGRQGGPDDRPGGGMPPGFDAAAKTLGVTADELFNAMESAGGRNADLTQVAKSLGITEAALKAALPKPPGR